MSYLSLKPRIFPSPPQQPGSPAFVLVDTTLIRIIGKPDLIHIAGLLGHRFSANWAVSRRARASSAVCKVIPARATRDRPRTHWASPRENASGRTSRQVAAGTGCSSAVGWSTPCRPSG